MLRCIQLAQNGRQNARPNPMVGAVIVAPDGTIIGEGYHIRCGEGHAEVNAFASVQPRHQHLIPESTLYVCLEPCSHYGKTPPCADLIVSRGVRRVVVGCVDPFAKVQGNGIRRLRDAGVEVTVGVLEKECQELNKVFFTFHRFHRPFVTLKWAESADGFIGGMGEDGQPATARISNTYTQMLCHKLRAEHQAILVGRTTWLTDHPSLTTRRWYGPNPLRFVLSHHQISASPDAVDEESCDDTPNVVKGSVSSVLSALFERGVQSLLVEGGAAVLQQFIDAGVWDEAYVEQGQLLLRRGTPAPRFVENAVPVASHTFDGNTITHYKLSRGVL